MSELKCCPFCGGEAKIATYDWGYSVKEYWIYCNPCDCASGRYHSKEEAINAWNTRTPMANIVEKLEEEKERTVCEGVDCDNCPYTKECWGGEMSYKVILDKAINIVKQEINNGLE